MILDHNRKPHNCRKIEDADFSAEGYNPLCGDRVTVFIKMNGEVIEDITFQGSGCAISTASASMMTDSLKGKTLVEVKKIFDQFRGLTMGEKSADLGKLEVFSGVCQYPVRVKCATLVWHAVIDALKNRNKDEIDN